MSDNDEIEYSFTEKDFMQYRTVLLNGQITSDSVGPITKHLLSLQKVSNDRINLLIDSKGGQVDAALELCDLINFVLVAPIRGIALGRCHSAATFIMLHCNERLSTPHSSFLIHSGFYNGSIPMHMGSADDFEPLIKQVKETAKKIKKIYLDKLTPMAWENAQPKTAEKVKLVKKLIARGDQEFNNHLSAEEAVEFGIVDRIVEEKLDIFTR
jgi:ATP-dependent protease ClpP protease subunit